MQIVNIMSRLFKMYDIMTIINLLQMYYVINSGTVLFTVVFSLKACAV